jgi:hypothetical protein
MAAALANDDKTVRVCVRLFPCHLRETNADGDVPLTEYRKRVEKPCKTMEGLLTPPFEPSWVQAWTRPAWYGQAESWKNVAW